MKKNLDNKILVTGLVRFGTSWIGNMLSLGKDSTQIFEPFNIWHSKFFGKMKINYHFVYDNKDNQEFIQYINDLQNLRFDWISDIREINSFRLVGKFLFQTIPFAVKSRFSKNLIIKDPYAFFLAEHLSDNFDFKIVMIMRHPASFVASMLGYNGKWDRHNYCYSILNQKHLMEDYNLYEFKESLKKFSEIEEDRKKRKLRKFENEDLRLERACLIWKIYATVFLRIQQRDRKNIFTIFYEDFAMDPLTEFSDLYRKLGLTYTEKIEKLIEQSTGAKKILSDKVVDTRRNSKALVSSWKKRLNKDQIEYILNFCSYEMNCLYKDENEY